MSKLGLLFFFSLSLLALGACSPEEGAQLASLSRDEFVDSEPEPVLQASTGGEDEGLSQEPRPEYRQQLQAFVETAKVDESVGRQKKGFHNVSDTVGGRRLGRKNVTEIEIRIRRTAADAGNAERLARDAEAEARAAAEAAQAAAEAARLAEAEAAAKRAAAEEAARRAAAEEAARRAAAEQAAAEEAARQAAAEEAARKAALEAARLEAERLAREAAAAEAQRKAAEAAAQKALAEEAARKLEAERKAEAARKAAEQRAAEARAAAIEASRADILFYINKYDQTKKLRRCLSHFGKSVNEEGFLAHLDKSLNWHISFALFAEEPRVYPMEQSFKKVRYHSEPLYVLKRGMFDSDPPGFWGKADPAVKRGKIFHDSLVNRGQQFSSNGNLITDNYDVPKLWHGSSEIADPLSGLAKFLKDGTAFRHNAKKYVVIVDHGHLPYYTGREWGDFLAKNRGVKFILLSSRRSAVSDFSAKGAFKWIPFCGDPKAAKKLADYIVESYGAPRFAE